VLDGRITTVSSPGDSDATFHIALAYETVISDSYEATIERIKAVSITFAAVLATR
jgi:hypothetical protein